MDFFMLRDAWGFVLIRKRVYLPYYWSYRLINRRLCCGGYERLSFYKIELIDMMISASLTGTNHVYLGRPIIVHSTSEWRNLFLCRSDTRTSNWVESTSSSTSVRKCFTTGLQSTHSSSSERNKDRYKVISFI